jgi:hypothetical protein
VGRFCFGQREKGGGSSKNLSRTSGEKKTRKGE